MSSVFVASSLFAQVFVAGASPAFAGSDAPPAAKVGASGQVESSQAPVDKKASLAQIERDFKAAGARYSASDYLGAISGFVQCLTLYEMNGHTEVTVRGAILFNLGKAYEKAFETEREARYLRLARDTYVRYINESGQGANYEDVDYVKLRLADLEREIEARGEDQSAVDPVAASPSSDDGSQVVSAPAPVGTAPATKSQTVDPVRLERSAKFKRKLGIGLLAGGGGALALGTGVLALAVVYAPDPLDEGTEQWDEDAAISATLATGGVGLMLLGVGSMVTGGILHSKSKQDLRRAQSLQSSRVHYWGMPTAGGATFGMAGRF